MSNEFSTDSMIEMFVFETTELITQLEDIALDSEESNALESEINEVFRIVHTVKGSAGMMEFHNIAELSHSLEDVFFYIRDNEGISVDYTSLVDLVLKTTDYIKNVVEQVQSGDIKAPTESDDESKQIESEIKKFLKKLKGVEDNDKSEAEDKKEKSNNSDEEIFGDNEYKVIMFFEDGCEMENVRAFNVVKNLTDVASIMDTEPKDILENDNAIQEIRQNGLTMHIKTDLNYEEIKNHLASTLFLKEFNIETLSENSNNTNNTNSKENDKQEEVTENNKKIDNINTEVKSNKKPENDKKPNKPRPSANVKQSMISVNLEKLDKLMDLVGELVISQEMVVQNSELEGLVLNDFYKASRQLKKVTNDIQDAVMSIRMVPVSGTFKKMNRIVRDMSKKLDKEVKLKTIGENTEVDKNVIEHLADPLMHIIRNSMDHGIESTEERIAAGKPEIGTVTLEAKDDGGEVCIIVKDDGKGLDREHILEKGIKQGIVENNGKNLSDKDIYNLIFLPGFSTNKQVTEFSGRGVGMDVVNNNMSEIGGKAIVDSTQGEGTTITLKIPLTLAIIEGMKIKVGNSIFVVPITSIKESFRVSDSSTVLDDLNNSEMIMLRGECIPLLRLHDYYNIESDTTNLKEGIIIVVENESKVLCLFADKVLGEQQVVVKALPKYLKNIKGVCGCSVMGDGSVCLISDVAELFNK